MTQSASGVTSTQWTFVPVRTEHSLEPIVLKDAVKFSDFFVRHNQNLKFEDLEKDFVIDQDVDVDQNIIDIAARCIVVCPNVTVRAKEIAFRAPNGYFNFGRLNYEYMESWSPSPCGGKPSSCGGEEGPFIEGQESRSNKHLWPLS